MSLPALFISHGSPMLAIDGSAAHHFIQGLAHRVGRPNSILMISAHWETAVPAVSLAEWPETIHDFGGFPRALYEIRYPAPGAPALAARTAALLEEVGLEVQRAPARGLDHGAWVPLKLAFPEADIPVTQLSVQPHLGPEHHFSVGRALRPLREEGTLIVASGAVTHNLQAFFQHGYSMESTAPDWVVVFADWLAEAIREGRVRDLLAYRSLAPHAVRNHPSEEHLLPLFVALGAASDSIEAERLHESQAYGVIAMDAYALR